jgi:hypothetical protein
MDAITLSASLAQHPLLCYGYGAKVIPKTTKDESLESSSMFALNGNFFSPSIDSLEMVKKHYYNTLARVQLSLPVNLSKILGHVNQLASIKKEASEAETEYFVVTVITAGVIDDIEDCIAAVI